MADESFFLGFTTDVNDVVAQVGAAMPRLERILAEAGGTIDGLDIGGALLRNFQADLAKMGEVAATQTARIRNDVERTLSATSASRPFQAPTGGAYSTQANQVNTQLLGNVRQLASAYSDALPAELRQQLLPAIEAEARRYAQERLGVQRQINEADVASLKAMAAELRSGGLNVSSRAAISGGGNQSAQIGRRLDNLFPAGPQVGTASERAENEYLASLRAATRARAREAEIGTLAERVENEYLAALRARSHAAGPSQAEVAAAMRGVGAPGTGAGSGGGQQPPFRRKAGDNEEDPDDHDLPARRRTLGLAIDQATRMYSTEAQRIGNAESRAYREDEQLLQAKQELANATKVAAEFQAGTARRGGGYYQTGAGAIYKETANGARLVESDLELIRARETLARSLKAEQAAQAREHPQGFFPSFGSAFTSRSAYGGGAGQGFDLARVPSNLGARLGSLSESFAGFAALGGVFKTISDTKKETLDYIDSLTNLEVRMGSTGSVTEHFTNQLEGLSRLAGSNVGAELDAAARSVSAFRTSADTSAESLRQIGDAGATASSQLAVISGTDLPTASNNLIAIASSFGLASNSLSQVNDAIANAKQLGGDANDIASGLANIAGAAQEAGFNMQQAADLISLVTARTNESGQAAATRITALFSLLGSHQTTLQGLGVDTTQSTKSQIDQLAAAFPKLSVEQQKSTLSALGGRTALRELIPLLRDNSRLQEAYAASLDKAGAGASEFNRKNSDLAGLFRKLGGDITNIQLNLVRSGVFDGIGAALKALEPGLRTISDLLGEFDQMIALVPGLRQFGGTLLDAYLALKLLKSIGILPAFYANLPGIRGRGGPVVPNAIATRIPGSAQNAASKEEAAAKAEATAATEANTAAAQTNAAAKGNAAKTEATAAAATKAETVAKTEQTAAHEANAAAVLNEIAAINSATAAEVNEIAATDSQVASLEALAGARAQQVSALATEFRMLELETTGLTREAIAERLATKETLNHAEALQLLILQQERSNGVGEAGLLTRGRTGLNNVLGTPVGEATAGARGAIQRGASRFASGASAALGGPVGIGITAVIVGDQVWHSAADAADKAKKAIDDVTSAMQDMVTAANPDDMAKAADNLRTASGELQHAGDGVFGHIRNWAADLLPFMNNTRDVAKQAKAAAEAEDERSKALQAANLAAAQVGSSAVFGGTLTAESLKKGFQDMDLAGDSARQKIDALIKAMGGTNASNFGPGHLEAGGGTALGDRIGNQILPTLKTSEVQEILKNNPDVSASRAIGAANFDFKDRNQYKDPAKLAQLQKQITDTTNSYINELGLQGGGTLTDAQRHELAIRIANLYVDPKKSGKHLAEIRANAAEHIYRQLSSATTLSDTIVDQTTANAAQQAVLQQAQQDSSEITNSTGDKVAAARAALADINAVIAATEQKNLKVDTVTFQAQLAAQHAVANALNDRANLMIDLHSAQIGTDDAVGQALDALTKADNDYATAVANGDKDAITKGKIEQEQAKQAIKQALLAQRNSLVGLNENPNSQLNQDQGALQQARNALHNTNRYDSNGQQTTAYNNALKAVNDAEAKIAQDKVDQANAIAEASISSQDPTGQAAQSLQEAQQRLQFLISKKAGKTEIAAQIKTVNDLQNQYTQSQTEDSNSAIDNSTDQRDSVAVALGAYQKATNTYNSLLAQGAKGKPLDDAHAAMVTAHQQLNAANISSLNQDAESSVKLGDELGAARQAYLSLLNTAHTQVGSQQEATLRQAAQANVTYQRLRATIADNAAKLKIDPRDNIALGAEALANDRRVIAIPGQNTTDLQNERLQQQQDKFNQEQALLARTQSRRLAQARQGDPLSTASAQLVNARETLHKDLVGSQKYWDDLAALTQQEIAYASAQRDHAAAVALLAGDTTDPVEQARITLQKATQKLSDDQRKKTGDLAQDQIDKETAAQALQKAQFDQQLSNQQNAYQLHEESADQYLTFLKSQDSSIRKQLAGMKKGQEGYQQLVDELNTIDQAIQGMNSQLEGQFNLGSIKLPTVYEVRRAEAQGATAASSSVANSVVTNNVTINGVDMQAVISYLSSIIGKQSQTVATAGRKAA